MRLRGDALRNLPVETASGQRLGRVVGFEFDPDTHMIVTFIVRPSVLASPLTRSELLINRSQVISITRERMVVEDGVRTARAEARSSKPTLTKDVAPVVPASTRQTA